MSAVIENIKDVTTGLKVLWKAPNDNHLFDIDCSGKMSASDAFSSVGTATQVNQGKVSGSANLTLSGEAHNSAQKLQLRIDGGTDKEDYLIHLEGGTTGGNNVVADVLLRVRTNPADV